MSQYIIANCVIQTSYFAIQETFILPYLHCCQTLWPLLFDGRVGKGRSPRRWSSRTGRWCGSSSRTAHIPVSKEHLPTTTQFCHISTHLPVCALPLTSAPATVFLQFVLFQMFHQIYLLIPKLKLNGLGKSECVIIQPSDLPTRVGPTLQCKKLEVLSATPCSNTTPATWWEGS